MQGSCRAHVAVIEAPLVVGAVVLVVGGSSVVPEVVSGLLVVEAPLVLARELLSPQASGRRSSSEAIGRDIV